MGFFFCILFKSSEALQPPWVFFVSFFQFYQTRPVQLHPPGFQAGANLGFTLRAPQGLATPLGFESFFPFYQTCLLQAGPQP